MITRADEYYNALFKIRDEANIPGLAVLLPNSENIYNVDLNSRTIEAPEYLSVIDDHVSETIYFLVDRFYENIDMSQTSCIIQYINAKNEGRVYVVPFYDIETYNVLNKMLIPWCIEGEATKAAGEVTFSIRFFDIDTTGNYLTFNLSTLPSTSKILSSLNILEGYIPVEVDEGVFYSGTNVYYKKNSNGTFTRATSYNPLEQYYTLTDGYDYSAEALDSIWNRIANIERDTQAYWFDASPRSTMDN